MPTALDQLRAFQVGKEVTKGTTVAATKKLRGDFVANEIIDRYYSKYPAGYRAQPGGVGVAVHQGFEGTYNSELTFEEILWFISSGLRGSLAPVAGTTDQTWTADPQLTGHPTLDSFTGEYVESDGATNHVARAFTYGLTKSFKIDWAFNQEAKFSAQVFGRAPAAQAPTAAIVEYANREIAVSNLAKLYLDTTWAGLGVTALVGDVRSMSYELTTGNEPDYTLEGRAALDMPQHKIGLVMAKLQVVAELDAVSVALISNWRANDMRFLRIQQEGSLAAAAVPKAIKLDGAYKYTSTPTIGPDNQYRLVTFSLETVLDPTSSKTIRAIVVNKEAAL